MQVKDRYNIKANSNIVFQERCHNAILFDPDSGRIKIINETGKFIWNNLTGDSGKESLVKKIMDNFNISNKEKIGKDLEEFLWELEKLKFLEGNEN